MTQLRARPSYSCGRKALRVSFLWAVPATATASLSVPTLASGCHTDGSGSRGRATKTFLRDRRSECSSHQLLHRRNKPGRVVVFQSTHFPKPPYMADMGFPCCHPPNLRVQGGVQNGCGVCLQKDLGLVPILAA